MPKNIVLFQVHDILVFKEKAESTRTSFSELWIYLKKKKDELICYHKLS